MSNTEYDGFARPDVSRLIAFKRYGAMLYATMLTPTISSVEAPVVGEALRDALEDVEPGLSHLVVDIGRVKSVNSMALGIFIAAYTSALHKGVKFVLASVPGPIMDLLELTRTAAVLNACRDEKELERKLQP